MVIDQHCLSQLFGHQVYLMNRLDWWPRVLAALSDGPPLAQIFLRRMWRQARWTKPREILDVIFPSGNETAEIVHRCKEPLHFPAFSISAQPAAILNSAFAPVRSNQFDPILVAFSLGIRHM